MEQWEGGSRCLERWKNRRTIRATTARGQSCRETTIANGARNGKIASGQNGQRCGWIFANGCGVKKLSSAKEYLRQVKLLDVQIDSRLHELYHLKDMVRKITTTLSPVPSSGSGNLDRLGDSVAKIIDLQDEINRDVDRFVDLKKDIMAMTEGLTDADQVNVIHKRYFEYKTWEQIACEMYMSYRNVCYIHGKALLAVTELMKGKEDGQS